jgi:ATP-dependent Clp protease ATP-binding subunit ClpA
MSAFSVNFDQSLHRSLATANERHHEYVTLEHLLLALIDDEDAGSVMRACDVDLQKLRHDLIACIETELENLINDGSDNGKFSACDPTCGDARAVRRTRKSLRR